MAKPCQSTILIPSSPMGPWCLREGLLNPRQPDLAPLEGQHQHLRIDQGHSISWAFRSQYPKWIQMDGLLKEIPLFLSISLGDDLRWKPLTPFRGLTLILRCTVQLSSKSNDMTTNESRASTFPRLAIGELQGPSNRQRQGTKLLWFLPICSMSGIVINLYPQNHPDARKYTIHGASGPVVVLTSLYFSVVWRKKKAVRTTVENF